MSTVLVTGINGMIAGPTAANLAQRHDVVGITRRCNVDPGYAIVEGSFHEYEDLRRLDDYSIDVVLHLAAATGDATEHTAMQVNVEGSRRLMRYAMERGCRKFVMASSIAAVGMEDPAFRPLKLPIDDEHPSLARQPYGQSKYLMEQITHYLHRQDESIDVTNLRLASIYHDDALPKRYELAPPARWMFGLFTALPLSETIRAIGLAVEAPHKPGVRTINIVGSKIWSAVPLPTIMRHWYGDAAAALGLEPWQREGHEYDSAYDFRRARDELGFEPAMLE